MNACRAAAVVVASLVVAGLAAQPPVVPTPVVLRLIPAAEPVPALRYRLLPELRDITTGNAVASYYRAFSPEWQTHRQDKNWSEKIGAAMEAPADSPALKEFDWLRDWALLKEVDRGARRSYCDWQLTDRLREDGIGLLIPDVQGVRQFAAPLAVRARLQMADGKFADAAKSLQTGFALARHVGDGPTLIQSLVGIAIASTMLQQVETWVQTPGSPNLFWALSDLPTPLIDLRSAIQGERIWIDSFLPGLRDIIADPSRPPLPVDALRQAVRKIGQAGDANHGNADWLAAGLGIARYPGAKRFLAEHGWTPTQIEAMPALQAILLQEVFEYDRHFDAIAKAVNLPDADGLKVALQAQNELVKSVSDSALTAPVLAKLLLPASQKVLASRVRLDRRIAALRVIEAIRLYAAANDGRLPPSLADIQLVPVPNDPGTGQPFGYTLANGTATLTAPMLPGMSPQPAYALRYDLTLAK